MGIDERGILVKVFALSFDQIRLKTPVQTLDMTLGVCDQSVPVSTLALVDWPALCSHIVPGLSQDTSVVHHFLGDTSHIHTSASKPPLGASWGGRYEIGKSDS